MDDTGQLKKSIPALGRRFFMWQVTSWAHSLDFSFPRLIREGIYEGRSKSNAFYFLFRIKGAEGTAYDIVMMIEPSRS